MDQHDAVLSRGDPVFLELDDQGHKRVPNCILFDQFGDRDAFGYQARERNDSKPKALRPRCAYFERVKKNLQQEGVSINPRQLYCIHLSHILPEDILASESFTKCYY